MTEKVWILDFQSGNQPGNDVTGMVARSEKIVNTVEKVMSMSIS